ncbi:MAG: hypothetical protein K8E24_014340 [Methanobacterium paludis]|nr:hypothetical protein [Methanobacterium paludis]
MKYLNYIVDRTILTEFDPLTIDQEWKNYKPTINSIIRTTFNQSVDFSDIVANTPIILEMLYDEQLDDRSSLEVDILSSTALDVGELEIQLCEGYNTATPKMILKNVDPISENTLTTVSFQINTQVTKKVTELSSIRTIAFNFKKDVTQVTIAKIMAYNQSYTFTLDQIINTYYKLGINYILSGLGKGELPDNDNIKQAVYMASAYYMWMKQESSKFVNGKKGSYGTKLLSDADTIVLEYINGGTINKNPNKRLMKQGGFLRSRL